MDLHKRPLLFSLLAMALITYSSAYLTFGFYDQTCPYAESLVRQAVAAAYAVDSGVAPGLIRMHFHDCFVRGCDGSVLIDSTANNIAEKDAPPNNPSLHGFEVIDAAKSAIEAICPQVVSCADILAFAARDSVQLTGYTTYEVPAGRRDGSTSIASEANANLPSPFSNSAQLINSFAAKGLTAEEMVTLSGAHSIGVSHCSSFTNRLYNFSSTSSVDPTLSLAYATWLRARCPNMTANVLVYLDYLTPKVLDNKYYTDLQLKLGLLTSDQALVTDPKLNAAVNYNAYMPNWWWATKFTWAMVKMGQIEVLTGTAGEIRKNCRVVNSASSSTPWYSSI